MTDRIHQLLERLTSPEQSELEAFADFIIARRRLKHPTQLTDDLPTPELMEMVMRGGGFDWLNDEREDVSILTDGEAPAWPPAS